MNYILQHYDSSVVPPAPFESQGSNRNQKPLENNITLGTVKVPWNQKLFLCYYLKDDFIKLSRNPLACW